MLEKLLDFLFAPFRTNNTNSILEDVDMKIEEDNEKMYPDPDIVIVREVSNDYGTFGKLTVQKSGWICDTLELPWRSNKRRVSCIPEGTYHAVLHTSPRFGKTIWIQDVPARSEILIHTGNVAGDKEKGFRSDVDGCILVGSSRGVLYNQPAVLQSRVAMNRLLKEMDKQKFIIQIIKK